MDCNRPFERLNGSISLEARHQFARPSPRWGGWLAVAHLWAFSSRERYEGSILPTSDFAETGRSSRGHQPKSGGTKNSPGGSAMTPVQLGAPVHDPGGLITSLERTRSSWPRTDAIDP